MPKKIPNPRVSILKAFLLLFPPLWMTVANAADPFALRISCGARRDVESVPTNTSWYRDFGYTGGRPGNASRTSFITPRLRTLRYFTLSDGPENCYQIDSVPNGVYSVRLFFAVVAQEDIGNEPLFDISIQGTQIYSMKPGWSEVDDQSFVEVLVSISGSSVSACFHSTGHGDPAILSIEILQVDNNAYLLGQQWGGRAILRTAKRLSCGAGKPAFDQDLNGTHWGGDRFWEAIKSFQTNLNQAISTESPIRRTSLAPNFYPELIYKYAIVSMESSPDLSFSMDVEPNKNYSIWLHFAEIDPKIQVAGSAVFDILINGDVAFRSVDVFSLSGGSNTAVVLNKTVAVSGRSLTITLHPTKGTHSFINAIEVFEVIPMEFRTSSVEVEALQSVKRALGLPRRFGWNGDPCVPQEHPWSGVACQFNPNDGTWVIDGLGLSNQGLRGFLSDALSRLKHLQNINFSDNSIHGAIPPSLGTVTNLVSLDLSYNMLNGTIPETLGQLTSLQTIYLNSNFLSGRVPSALGGLALHRARFNFTDNAGLCGIPGLPSCGPHLSTSAKVGIAMAAVFVVVLIVVFATCMWKRHKNILRAKKLAAKEAPYAKARTHYVRDVQMARTSVQDQSRGHADGGSQLLSPTS